MRAGFAPLVIDDGRAGSDRLEIVSPSAAASFAAADLSCLLARPEIAIACQGIVRRGPAGDVREDFIAKSGGCGFIVDRTAFDCSLRELARQEGVNIEVARVRSIAVQSGGFELVLTAREQTRRIRTANIVDASGRAAVIARRLGGERQIFSQLTARRRECDVDRGAWLCFEPSDAGWSYSLSGPTGRRDAWEVAPHRKQPASESAQIVDASASMLVPAAGDGWIAIGDAAAAFDPISSQGLPHAVGSALAAAEIFRLDGRISERMAAEYHAMNLVTALHSEVQRRAVVGAFDAYLPGFLAMTSRQLEDGRDLAHG